MWFSYLVIFFTDVLQFSNRNAGIIMLIGQVADGLATPFVGKESDKSGAMCGRYGKRKGWHLFGTILVGVSFPFIFGGCLPCWHNKVDEWAKLIYFAPFVVIFQFGWASVQISHLCLIPELTSCAGERTWLNSGRVSMTVLSNIMVYVVLWQMIQHLLCKDCQLGPHDIEVFRYVSLGIVGIGGLFALFFHFAVKEKTDRRAEAATGRSQANRASVVSESSTIEAVPIMTWKDWFKEPQYYQVGLLYMLTRLIYNVSQVFIPYYVSKTLKLDKIHISLVPLTVFISGFLATTVTKPLSQRLGRKITYLIGLVFILGACIYMAFNNIGLQMYVASVILGVGSSTILVASLSLTADLIGKNTECSGFVFGSMSFTDKVSNGIAVLVIQALAPDCELTSPCDFYKNVMSYILGGFVVAAFVALLILMPQNVGKRRSLSLSISTSDDDTRPLLSAPPITDLSYGSIDEGLPPNREPSMVRRQSAQSNTSPCRSPSPIEEAITTAYTEHPLLGSLEVMKSRPSSPTAATTDSA